MSGGLRQAGPTSLLLTLLFLLQGIEKLHPVERVQQWIGDRLVFVVLGIRPLIQRIALVLRAVGRGCSQHQRQQFRVHILFVDIIGRHIEGQHRFLEYFFSGERHDLDLLQERDVLHHGYNYGLVFIGGRRNNVVLSVKTYRTDDNTVSHQYRHREKAHVVGRGAPSCLGHIYVNARDKGTAVGAQNDSGQLDYALLRLGLHMASAEEPNDQKRDKYSVGPDIFLLRNHHREYLKYTDKQINSLIYCTFGPSQKFTHATKKL